MIKDEKSAQYYSKFKHCKGTQMIKVITTLLFMLFPLFAKDYAYKTMAPVDFNDASKQLYAFLKETEQDSIVDLVMLKKLLDQGADPNVFVNEILGDPYISLAELEELKRCIAKVPLNEVSDTAKYCENNYFEVIPAVALIKKKIKIYDILKLFLEAGLDPNSSLYKPRSFVDMLVSWKYSEIEKMNNNYDGIPISLKVNEAIKNVFILFMHYGYTPNLDVMTTYQLYSFFSVLLRNDLNVEDCDKIIFKIGFKNEKPCTPDPFQMGLLIKVLNNGFNPLVANKNGKTFLEIVKSKSSTGYVLQKVDKEMISITEHYESVWRNKVQANTKADQSSLKKLTPENLKATSELESTKKNYVVSNLIDNDTTTAWVEGNERYGLHEGFSFTLSETSAIPEEITLRNGYTKNQNIWISNCRIKQIGITVDSTLIGVIDLEDSPKEQCANVKEIFLPYQGKLNNRTIGITIFSIYGGTKYKDIALSEFQIRGTKK